MLKSLVVVDMQDFFFSEEPEELNTKILDVIDFYMEERAPIIVLEYRTNPYDPDDKRCGRTNDTIREKLKHYQPLVVIGKDKDDGSGYMRHYVEDHLEHIEEFELVGVNLDCCVMATAKGLASRYPDKLITIVEECCDSSSYNTEMYGYDDTLEDTVNRVNHCRTDNLRMLVNQMEVRNNDD
jgi:nicotinamidase-related amidase